MITTVYYQDRRFEDFEEQVGEEELEEILLPVADGEENEQAVEEVNAKAGRSWSNGWSAMAGKARNLGDALSRKASEGISGSGGGGGASGASGGGGSGGSGGSGGGVSDNGSGGGGGGGGSGSGGGGVMGGILKTVSAQVGNAMEKGGQQALQVARQELQNSGAEEKFNGFVKKNGLVGPLGVLQAVGEGVGVLLKAALFPIDEARARHTGWRRRVALVHGRLFKYEKLRSVWKRRPMLLLPPVEAGDASDSAGFGDSTDGFGADGGGVEGSGTGQEGQTEGNGGDGGDGGDMLVVSERLHYEHEYLLLQWLVLAGEQGHGKFNDVKHELVISRDSIVDVLDEPRQPPTAPGNGQTMHLFELVAADKTSFVFGASTERTKAVWLEVLRGAVGLR
jgi:hypothetical protein